MTNIYLYLAGEQKGPYFPGQLRSMLAEGAISAGTPAWHAGLAGWSSVGAILAGLPAIGGPPPVPPSGMPPLPRVAQTQGMSGGLIAAIIAGAILVLALPCCAGILVGPITNGIEKAKENVALQHARMIYIAMAAYAADHHGNFPDADEAPAGQSILTLGGSGSSPGASTSTEVFQKLIDEKYVSDPAIFYIAMPGKVRPVGNQLTADNVCFDVTAGLTSSAPNGLPIVFTTGFSVSYGNSIRVTRDGVSPFPGFIAVYTGKSGHFIKLNPGESAVIGPLFNPFGEKYRQLKP